VCEATPVEELVGRVQEATTFVLDLDGHELAVAASIGWVTFADADRSPGDLLKAADAAMYEVKAVRRGR
jgi:GGDEF domain-containing protein